MTDDEYSEQEAIADGYVVTRPGRNRDDVEVYSPDYGISGWGETFKEAFSNLILYCNETDEYYNGKPYDD